MKIKKILAGGLAAAAAGATIAFGALAQSANLGAYVQVTGNSLSSPVIVIGTPTATSVGYANDVVGAADIAAAVAGFATTPVAVGGGTTVSVSDGTDLATSNTKIFLGDTLAKSGLRATLTKTNLPTILAQGAFLDGAGTSYTYNQYINFGSAGTVTFGTSSGDLSDPKLYLDTGTSTSTPLFTMSVVFNKVLNVSSADVRGQTIQLFGKTYTIGSASTSDSISTARLVLFGGAGNSQTVSEGQEVEISVGGVTHKVKVIGVSDTTHAVISVDGTSKEVIEGNTYTIAGVDVFAESVYFFTKEAQLSQVKLSLGSSKITLDNGAAVKTGQTEDTIDGTLVTLTGTSGQGISKMEIAVTSKGSSNDYIVAGSAFTDPVFSALKVAFGGLNTGATDTITIDNSGTTAASLKFSDYRGNEKSIIWTYAGASLPFVAQLNDTSTRAYHVIEGETIPKNDYVLLAPSQESEFGHIFQYTTASSLGSSGAYIELKDVMSSDVIRVYLTGTVGGGSYTSASFYVDGQAYYVKNASTVASQQMVFTWGAGTDNASSTGSKITAFPLIKAKGGEYVTLVKSVALANGTYELPGNVTATINGCITTSTAGRLDYKFIAGCGSTNTLYAINQTGGGGVALTAAPAVLIYEEKGKNLNDAADVQNAIFATVADGGGTGVDMTIQAPVLTAATGEQFSGSQQTDNSVTEYYDRYGVHLSFDTDGQGLLTAVYPDDQASAMAGAGSDPKFSTAGGGGTYNAAVQIKNPVAKFDSEVSTASLTSDLILLGGPCANTLVATLLSSDNITCSSWAYTTGLIKEVTNAFGSGHKALIVAGTRGTDTRAMAAKVMQGTLAYST